MPDQASAFCRDVLYQAKQADNQLMEQKKQAHLQTAIQAYEKALVSCRWFNEKERITQRLDQLKNQVHNEINCDEAYYKEAKKKEDMAQVARQEGDWADAHQAYNALADHFDAIVAKCDQEKKDKAARYARIARHNRDQAWCAERMVKGGDGAEAIARGEASFKAEDWEEAIPYFEQAIQINQWVSEHCQDASLRQTAWFNLSSSRAKLKKALPKRSQQRCAIATKKALSVPGVEAMDRHTMTDGWWDRAEPLLKRQRDLYTKSAKLCQGQPSGQHHRQMLVKVDERLNQWGCQTLTDRAHTLRMAGGKWVAQNSVEQIAVNFQQMLETQKKALTYCSQAPGSGPYSPRAIQAKKDIDYYRCQSLLAQANRDLHRSTMKVKEGDKQQAKALTQQATSILDKAQAVCLEAPHAVEKKQVEEQLACQKKWLSATLLADQLTQQIRSLRWDEAKLSLEDSILAWTDVKQACPLEQSDRANANLEILKVKIEPQIRDMKTRGHL